MSTGSAAASGHPDTCDMATSPPERTRRSGYAPTTNVGVGRRGLHTRERIIACAAETFLVSGFHGTSLDAIAKAANASRATVYQYFAGKEEIFGELSAMAEHDALDHADRIGDLGPTPAGADALHRWLIEWADIYDRHAAVFAEFPGIGTAAGLSIVDISPAAAQFHHMITDRLRATSLRGLDPDDAAAALGRIPHMVHLYRHRAMIPLPTRDVVSASLTIAMQLMLFPDTPADVLRSIATQSGRQAATTSVAVALEAPAAGATAQSALSPIMLEVLSVSSTLFAEHGYYAVGMEDIAAGAQVSRATLYRYFSTKDKILAELTRLAVTEIEEFAATLSGITDAEALSKWMLDYLRFHRGYRGVIRAWLDGTVAEQLSAAEVEHGIGAIHHTVGVLLANAGLPTGMNQQVAAAVFLAILGRMTEPTAADSPDDDQRTAALMVTLLRRSLLRWP